MVDKIYSFFKRCSTKVYCGSFWTVAGLIAVVAVVEVAVVGKNPEVSSISQDLAMVVVVVVVVAAAGVVVEVEEE